MARIGKARTGLGVLASCATLALLVPGLAGAATVNVNTTSDLAPSADECLGASGDCSLRRALDKAAAGDAITLPASASHYVVSAGELTVDKDLTIGGAGASATVIDAGGSSGVFHVIAPATAVTFSGLTVTGGALSGTGTLVGGAAIRSDAGALTVINSVFSNNTVTGPDDHSGGGAIWHAGSGALSIAGSSFLGNAFAVLSGGGTCSCYGGGAVYDNDGSGQVLTGDTLEGNTVSVAGVKASADIGGRLPGAPPAGCGGTGGGAYYTPGGKLTIDSSTLNGNSISGACLGGAVFDGGGDFSLTSSTLTGNVAPLPPSGLPRGGGAIFYRGSAGVLTNDTIVANVSGVSGGGIVGGSVTLKNTILANNTAAVGGPDCGFGTFASAGHNIESADTCNLSAAGDRKNTDPRLGPLASNGGPTQTLAPLAGSPAINAGDNVGCPVTDQRGVVRPQALICDIGAVELRPPATVTTGAAGPVGADSARLAGALTPLDGDANVHFELGPTAAYGSVTPDRSAGIGVNSVGASGEAFGLMPRTTYHYRVVAMNLTGLPVFGADGTFTTLPAVPFVSQLGMTRTRFRRRTSPVSTAARPRPAPRGSVFKFSMSQDGTVRIAIDRLRSGRRVGKRCLSPSRARRRKPKCTRSSRRGTLTRRYGSRGRRRVAFSGWIGRTALAPGSYRATLTETTSGQPKASTARSVTFTILPG